MSSVSNKYITHKEAVPILESDIFSEHPDKKFAIGVFSAEDVLNYKPDSVEQAYLRLRANVYVDQTRMLGSEVKRTDGTELDDDDERSTHFVVLENLMMGRAAVFACMRVIEKTSDKNHALPIEEFFPEIFPVPAPQDSIEVSRFIIRNDNVRNSMMAKKELISTGLAYSFDNNLGPVYATLEPSFEKDLKLMRLPTKRIAEPKMVAEYNDHNLGIEIDKEGFKHRMGEVAVKNMTVPVGSFNYWGEFNEGV